MNPTKQTIIIELDLADQYDTDSAIKDGLQQFFTEHGHPYAVIDLGIDENGVAAAPHARSVTFFNELLARSKAYCRLRLTIDPKYMDGADADDICGIEELDEGYVTLAYRYYEGCNCHGGTQHGTVQIGLDNLFGDFEGIKVKLEREVAEARVKAEAEAAQAVEARRVAEEKRKRALLETLKKELGE